MKKIIPIFVIGIFVFSSFSAIATIENKKPVEPIADELDQYQEVMTENAAIPIGNLAITDPPIYIQVAQSFMPTKSIITRIELLIGKNSTAVSPLDISIRKELTEEDLTVTSLDPSLVPTETYDWVEIDIDDIIITAGETYYIVGLTENITDNYYAWGANNMSESYLNGCMWISIDEGKNWTNESNSQNIQNYESFSYNAATTDFQENVTWDMCFRTYGRNNDAPDTPTIEGPSSGKAGDTLNYVISSTDLDDDQVYYWISWFDDCPDIYWDGPYNSSEPITRGYTYEEQGTYTIRVKAKDVFDAESDFAILEIEIPRTRHSNYNIFYLLSQLFPNAFSTIIKILKL
jgi:hypothetical protein